MLCKLASLMPTHQVIWWLYSSYELRLYMHRITQYNQMKH